MYLSISTIHPSKYIATISNISVWKARIIECMIDMHHKFSLTDEGSGTDLNNLHFIDEDKMDYIALNNPSLTNPPQPQHK